MNLGVWLVEVFKILVVGGLLDVFVRVIYLLWELFMYLVRVVWLMVVSGYWFFSNYEIFWGIDFFRGISMFFLLVVMLLFSLCCCNLV